MGTEKRARQKAGHQARVEAQWRDEQRRRRKKSIIRIAIISTVIIGAVVLYSIFTGDDAETVSADATTTTVATTAAPATTTPTSTTPVGDSSECPAEDGSSPKTTQFDAAHPLCIDPTQKYVAAFSTTMGDFDVLIDPAIDEATANNFVTLARWHAYDGTIFHRIIDGFVVQGGDVEGLDGLGGPGYRFTGLRPTPGEYRIGSIAMANTGSDPANNGSQFFVITGQNGVALSPNFSLFGQVIDGLDVPVAMQAVETAPGDKPLTDVVLDTVDIRIASAEDLAAYDEALAG